MNRAIRFCAVLLFACTAGAQSPNVQVSPAPSSFTFTIEEVYFKHPHTYKERADKIEKAMIAIKVTIRGQGFDEGDTGPIVWLNRVQANIARVSPDGRVIEAFFYRRLSDLRVAAKRLERWELLIQPPGEHSAWAIVAREEPKIRTLTDAEWKHAQEIGREFGIDVPPRD
ncbi:MAG TPA: hypothetical protein VF057_10940 [Thermoanaerobaculia bacterium]